MLQKQLRRLEMEIRDSEARVRLHDTRLKHSAHALREGAIHAVGSKLLAGGVALAAVWLLKPRHAAAHHGRHAEAAHAPRRGATAGVLELLERWGPVLLPMLAPLLDRKVATFLGSLGLPVPVKQAAPLPTVEQLDLPAYAGAWYVIAHLPGREDKDCARDTHTDFRLDERGIEVHHRCIHDDGRLSEAKGRMRQPDARLPGQLEVTYAPAWLRWWPGVWRDHWVMHLDEDGFALVGTPERDGLWLLSRTPQLPEPTVEAMQALAQRHGFDTTRWQRVPQSDPQPHP